ncbi:MAG: flagellar basal body rod protein FlgB [Phenylobacterium sp.]|jgi:flagellar basal body rod protein FlgB
MSLLMPGCRYESEVKAKEKSKNMIEQVTLHLLQLAMDISQTRHKAAAANIASANIPGAAQIKVNFDDLFSALAQADDLGRELLVQDIRANWTDEKSSATSLTFGTDIKLDEQSAELLLASGKYKLLTEGLNRKLGLMQVAVNGGKR